MESTSSQTGTTLFGLLEQPQSSQAWNKFVDRYGPQIFRWSRARGLQQADAENVTQEVLCRFAKVARTFTYDPQKSGFRAWLRTVTRNALADLVHDMQKARGNGDIRWQGIIDTVEAAESLEHDLDAELHRELLEQAMHLVRLRVEPKTWQAFELLAIDELSGKAVATQTQMSVAAVYMAKSRVVHMLEDEIRRME